MLARRFTIVCLLAMLFGMFFAILVQKSNGSERSWEIGRVMLCGFENGSRCNVSRHH